MTTPEPLPSDLAAAHAMILAERAARFAAEAEAATAKETKRVLDLEIERLKLEIARLRRHRFGTSSERSARLEQLELALAELQETVAEADTAGELRAAERSPTGGPQHDTAQAGPPAAAGTPAAHAHRLPGAGRLPLLRRGGAQAGRGGYRDTGAAAGALVRRPARAREGLLPLLRDDQRGAGAVPSDRPRPCRPQPVGRGGLRQVRSALAAEPAEQPASPARVSRSTSRPWPTGWARWPPACSR